MFRQLHFISLAVLFWIFAPLWVNGGAISLQAQSSLDNSDSLSVDFFMQQAQAALQNQQADEAITFIERALDISVAQQDTANQAPQWRVLAQAHRQKGNYGKAIKYYLLTFKTLKNSSLTNDLADLNLEIGGLYERELNAYTKAAEYYQRAYEQYLKNDNQAGQQKALEYLGRAYYTDKNYETALIQYDKIFEFYHQSADTVSMISILRKKINVHNIRKEYEQASGLNMEILALCKAQKNIEGIATAYNNIAYNLSQLKDYKQALAYFQKTHELDKENKRGEGAMAQTLINLGVTYHNLNQHSKAVNHLQQALKNTIQEKNWKETARIQTLIALIYLRQQDYRNANEFAQNALASAKKSGNAETLQNAYETYAIVLQDSNNYEEALVNYKKHLAIRDSIRTEQRIKEQELSQKQYDIEKTEKELRLVLAEEEVQELIVRQQQLELEKKGIELATQAQELTLLQQKNKLQEATFEKQQLEKEGALQASTLEQQKLIQERQRQELALLQQEKQIQETLLGKKALQEKLRRDSIQILETANALLERDAELQTATIAEKNARIAENAARTRFVRMFALFLILLLALSILAGLYRWRDNQKLKKQNEEIESQKATIEQSYQDLQKTQSQLVESEKMASLGQLTAGVAHEINNPINFVSSNISPLRTDINELLEILEKYEEIIEEKGLEQEFEEVAELKEDIDYDYVKTEITHLLTGIADGANRTAEIVKGLRNFSRLDENEQKFADLNEGIVSTLLILKTKWKGKIKIVKNLNTIPQILCYPGKLNQVFMNILTNAIQAIEQKMKEGEGGENKIYINTHHQNDTVIISIKDTGIGMTEAVKKRIFEPFYTTKNVGDGTGLGLSITFGIIQNHKGTIAVHSEVGKGTEFVITLPVKQ